jgi:hypothetical protein
LIPGVVDRVNAYLQSRAEDSAPKPLRNAP